MRKLHMHHGVALLSRHANRSAKLRWQKEKGQACNIFHLIPLSRSFRVSSQSAPAVQP